MARTKGSSDLSNDQKARILANKNLQLFTQKKIADQEGVSRMTVNQIKPETVTPEVLELSKHWEKKLTKDMKRVSSKLLNYLEKSVDNETLPPKSISTAFGIIYDKIRLAEDKPTTITKESSPQHIALKVFIRMENEFKPLEILALIKEDFGLEIAQYVAEKQGQEKVIKQLTD